MDLIQIEIDQIDRRLEHIRTLCKNQKNKKKIQVLNRRREDLVFRLEMKKIEDETEDEAEDEDNDDDVDNNDTINDDENLLDQPSTSSNVHFEDEDLEMINAIAESSARIKRLNKRRKLC